MIHCGFVGLLGLPNAGKSTFLNKALGEKVVIISEKPQTTRKSFTGLLSNKDYQLIVLDAPGYVEPKRGLFDYLHAEFDRVIEKSEHLIVLVANDQKNTAKFQKFWNRVEASKKPFSLLITKIDLKASDFILVLKAKLEGESKLVGEYSVRLDKKKQMDQFLTDISLTLPQENHPLYDPDMISLDRVRDIVAEFIREQCFLQLQQEIPYGLGVIIKSYKKEKGLQHIQANILVEKENHKGILIGKGGAQLKKIGQDARAKIEELLGEKVFLGLHVSHKKNWTKNRSIMKEVGYVHES